MKDPSPRRGARARLGALVSLAFTCWISGGCVVMAAGTSTDTLQQDLQDGARARALGNMDDSIALLERAAQRAQQPASRVRALAELGVSLEQAGRLAEADSTLQMAYRESSNKTRYLVALALGNQALRLNDRAQATRYYQEVIASVPHDVVGKNAQVMAELNLAGLLPGLGRLTTLESLLPRVEAIEDPNYRAHALFGVGQQASEALELARMAHSPQFDQALRISYRAISSSQELARNSGDIALAVDAADALAQLYESEGRVAEAGDINRSAIAAAGGLTPGQAELPLARLEWRAARLAQQRGEAAPALASFMRAAGHLETIRQDLPIEDARGHSSYQTLQRPVFAGLIDVLLKDVDALAPETQQGRIAMVMDLTEQAHQAELQDYLGDRCSVESVRKDSHDSIAPGAAVVYFIILKDRLEIVVSTSKGLLHRAVPVSAAVLAREIQVFRSTVLDPGSSDYLEPSRHLYEWLIAPFSAALAQADVRSLVMVPDGYLRLVPFGALHDGSKFLAQRYWISSVTGLSMTERSAQRHNKAVSLYAGLSTPGPVVNQLLAMGFTGSAALANNADTRGLKGSGANSSAEASATPESTLRNRLTLPGVQSEIQDLVRLTRNVSLLNDQFTVGRFAREVQSGRYNVVHIASHGFFGSSAGESFLLAYDNVIRIAQLQQMIAVNDAQQVGIDLLTLSACDTATGDDRAPLGFAGAGIKARAGSVLGSLWAVSDAATQQFMELFYKGLMQHTKTEAYTEAQRGLIQSTQFSHPYYWAPFILTGDWN
jgi:CHAT domain-containing protein